MKKEILGAKIPGSGFTGFARFQVPVPPVQSRYTTVTVSSEVPGSGSADPADPAREDEAILRCKEAIDATATPLILVIYTWFLYEKLLQSLQFLLESEQFHPGSAIALGGKKSPGTGALWPSGS